MRKLKFVLPSNKSFQIYFPNLSLKKNTKSEVFLKIMTLLNLSLIFVYLVTLPFARYILNLANTDTSEFIYTVIFLGIILLIYLVTIILGGSKKLVDPPLFLGVLIFALLATSAAVFTSEANVSNTFGITGFRGIGGLTIMVEVALFYLLTVYITNRTLFRRAFKYLAAGLMLLVIILALSSIPNSDLISPNLGIVTLTILLLFVLLVLLFNRGYRLFNFSVVLLFTVALLLIINTNTQYYNNLLVVLLSAFFGSIAVFILLFTSKAEWVNEKINDLKKSFSNLTSQRKLSDFFIELLNSILLLAPLIIFLIIALLLINKNINFDFISTKLTEIRDASNNVFVLSNLKRTLLGLGGNSYTTAKSLVTNVILVQGLLGLLAYVFIWTYGIVQSFITLRRMKRIDADFKLGAFLLFVLTFIPVYSLFALTPLVMVLIWWVAFALVGILSMFEKKKIKELYTKEDWKVSSIKFRGKDLMEWGYYIKYFIVVLVLILGGYLLYSLLKVIGV